MLCRRLLLLVITGVSSVALAGAYNPYHQISAHSYHSAKQPAVLSANTFNWFAGVGTGMAVPHVNSSTYGYAPAGSGLPSDQFVQSSAQNEPLLSLLVGYRFSNMDEWFPYYSLGLQYTYVLQSQVSGVIDQFSNPAFENYDFQYNIQRQTVLGVAKADIYQWRFLLPYVTAGLGLSRNNVQDYSEQALPGVTPRVSPGFGSKASIYGSWMIGFGFDIIFNPAWVGSLEYSYGHYGYAETANGSLNTGTPNANYSNSDLQTRLTTSTFAANIVYFFG